MLDANNNNNKHELNLWQKLAAISKEIGHVDKTGKNQHFNYTFMEHSQIVASLRPIMDEYGVTVDFEAMDATFTVESGSKTARVLLHMKYYVTNADKPSEHFERLWVSEAMDQQDKGINKALTAAEKNVFMKLFHISDVDLEDDANDIPQTPAKKTAASTSQPTRPTANPAPRPQQQQQPQQPNLNPVTPIKPNMAQTPVATAVAALPDYFKVIAPVTAACPKCDGPMELVTGSRGGVAYRGERCTAKGCDFKRMVK